MKTKLSAKFYLALTLFSLIGQVAWVVENMYLNVFIYKMFNASAADISVEADIRLLDLRVDMKIGVDMGKIGHNRSFLDHGLSRF